MSEEFEERYAEKINSYKQLQYSKIPKEWLLSEQSLPLNDTNVSNFIEESNLLTDDELTITNSSTKEILNKIHSGQWSSLSVTKAFAHKASIAQQLVNPLTEIMFQEAFSKAQQLDDYYREHHAIIGPLHGLPISVKDEFDIKGHRTTLGLVSQLDSDLSQTTSPNIEILISKGAIPFVKTNVPTAAFNIVTTNNVFGPTLNPYQRQFSSGGSTGGEAALVALRGSPFGVGSDLGGSIRQPSSFTGIFGFKPTSNRVPHWNDKIVVAGLESLNGTNGCLSNDIDGLELYFKTIVDSEPWLNDTRVVPIPWKNDIIVPKRLKVGLLIDDGKIRVTPPIKRALDKVRQVLIDAGHEVVEFKPEDGLILEIAEFADKFMTSNGMKKLYDELVKTNEPNSNIDSIKNSIDLNVSELWELQKQRTLKVNKLWKYWKSLDLDFVISPVTGLSGTRFDGFVDFSYSPLSNVIDFPSCTFPVLKADKNIDVRFKGDFEPRNEFEKKVWDDYDIELSHGVPIGLQLIGPRYEEEKVLQFVRLVSSLIKYE